MVESGRYGYRLLGLNEPTVGRAGEGTSGSAMAKKLGVCTSTIQHRKRSLAKAIAAFMGDDILIEVNRLPRWKDCLDATRERQAVRYERAH